MMMPANFSAVAENEMTYVMGGSVADYLAPASTAFSTSSLITEAGRCITSPAAI